jgi:hypothetical protein
VNTINKNIKELSEKMSCWPITIKITVGQQLFVFAFSTGKCRNDSSHNK